MPKRLHPQRPDSLVRLHVAEPAPLGLFGLAMGCLILMCVDFEWTEGKLMLVPWIFLLPALLQLIAGTFDFLRHNVFGGTAFVGYAIFWFGLASVYYLEIQYANHEDMEGLIPSNPSKRQHTGVIAIGYLIFSVVLTIISMGVNRTFFSILCAIDFTFCMLILHIFVSEGVPPVAVGVGLVLVFLTAIYGFIAVLIMKVAGGEVLPIGSPFVDWSRYVIHDKTLIIDRRHAAKQKVNGIDTDNDTEEMDEEKEIYYTDSGQSTHDRNMTNDGLKKRKAPKKGTTKYDISDAHYHPIEMETVKTPNANTMTD